jgi:hypothetical protein
MCKSEEIEREVLGYLNGEYERRGNNFYFKVKSIGIDYSNHQKGRAVANISKNSKFHLLERWNTKKSPAVWHTNFGGK